MKQVQSEMALLDDQLAHTRVLSPFDGIVVSGDLSQSLGSPVEKGKVLFEIAPLDSYRIVLEVDERDIADVRVGAAWDSLTLGISFRTSRGNGPEADACLHREGESQLLPCGSRAGAIS